MTIYDIAAEAGVSASTVSRVINNKSGVKPSTKKMVEALLAKYNYSPDQAARGLVCKNSRMIGILVSDIRNQHYTEGAYIIGQAFLEKGYCALIFNTGSENEKKAEYVRLLSERKVEGAVFIGSTFQAEEVKEAVSKYLSGIPVVMANGSIDLGNISSVTADEEGGVAEAVRYLSSKGKRRIIYLDGEDTPSNRLKRRGYLSAMASLGLEAEVHAAANSYEGGLEAMSEILDEESDVDGVMCAVDLIAVGALRAATDRGLKVPDEISFIGVDNSPYASYSNPRLTTVDTHLHELSLCSARNLLEAVAGHEVVRKIIIPSELVVRES